MLFVLPKLPVYARYNFTFDDVYYLGRGLDALGRPALLLAPDYVGRAHPLFLALMGATGTAFGPSGLALGTLLLTLHLAAACLVGRLAATLGSSPLGRLLAATSFLFFAAPNSVFGSVAQLARPLALDLALLALLALAAYARGAARTWAFLYLALYLASLLAFEDLVLLPFIGLILPWAMRQKRPGLYAVHAGAFLILAASLACTATSGAASTYGLALGRTTLLKAAALPVELARDLLLLHADLRGPGAVPLALNLAPILTLVVLAALAVRPAWTTLAASLRSRPTLFALAFLALAALPPLFRPTGAVWHSRYLYVPGAGLALLLAAVAAPTLAAVAAARRWAPALLALALLFTNVANMEHMLRKIQGEWSGIVAPERWPQAFFMARVVNDPLTWAVADIAAPRLTPAEFEAVCTRWVRDHEACRARFAPTPKL